MYEHQPHGRDVLPARSRAYYGGTEVWLDYQCVFSDVAAHKRWVSPEEVGHAALYYASDLSSAITGDKIKVDCGRF